MTAPDAKAVAARLTPRQSAALLRMPLPFALETTHGVQMLGSWVTAKEVGAHGSTLMSMNGLGGVDPDTLQCGPVLVTYDWGKGGRRYWMLTTEGLAVRAELERQSNG